MIFYIGSLILNKRNGGSRRIRENEREKEIRDMEDEFRKVKNKKIQKFFGNNKK